MKLSSPALAAILLCLGPDAVAAKLKPGQKILLSKIETLTLRNDQMTKGRRVEPIPQVCVKCPLDLEVLGRWLMGYRDS